jgi:hypothetical protein
VTGDPDCGRRGEKRLRNDKPPHNCFLCAVHTLTGNEVAVAAPTDHLQLAAGSVTPIKVVCFMFIVNTNK